MTTEETELTFVRCPSCRSLVPAVATRCRMCGYSFESGAEAEAEEGPGAQAKSRVRQRTISASREQLDELAAEQQQASERRDESEEAAEEQQRLKRPSLFPPQEEDDSAPLFASDPFTREAAPVAEDDSSSVLAGFSAAIRSGSEEQPAQKKRGIEVEEPNLFDSSTEEPFVEASASEPAKVEVEADDFERAEEEQPRNDDTREAMLETQAAEVRDDRDSGELDDGSVDASSDSDDEDEASDEEQEQKGPRKRRRRRRRRKSGSERVETQEVEKQEESVEMNGMPQQSRKARAVTGEEGVLVGWFVSFADNKKGEAEELRSGKFFIGRTQLRSDDMVIDKDGISTPHCLVAVGNDGSLKVQDLMSDQGTMVQRLDSDDFETVTDVAELEHGDKLRLGSYEVTICLLPSDDD